MAKITFTDKIDARTSGLNREYKVIAADMNEIKSSVNTLYDDKQDLLVSGTNIKTINSGSILGSGDLTVQEVLVSGTNIKTINGVSVLGSGNLTVQETLVSGTNIKTINGVSVLGSGDLVFSDTTLFDGGKTLGGNVTNDLNGNIFALNNGSVILNASAKIDTENFLLSGKTYIRGLSTGGGTSDVALQLLDSSDSSLWQWRNNGDIYMGQDSSLFVNGGIFTINAGDPLNTNNAALTIDSSNSTDVNRGVSFKIIGNNSNEFTISERGNLASTNINGNTILNMLNATNNAGLKIDVSQSELISDEWLQKPTSSAVQYIRNGFDSNQCQTIWAVGSNFANDAVHWIRAGTSGFATVQFFRQGVVGNGFIVGGSEKIGSEQISLQGNTLIGDTGDSVGFYGVTPTARATTGIGSATFTANTGTNVHETSTFGGYTIAQVVQALQDIGILT